MSSVMCCWNYFTFIVLQYIKWIKVNFLILFGLVGIKPHVTANEQPSVEATHKDEAPVLILAIAFSGVAHVGKAIALAFGKAGCKVQL